MNTAAIARHLNVAANAIVEVQEWARVLWVRVRGLGARFVSKKVAKIEVTEEERQSLSYMWNDSLDAIYSAQEQIIKISSSELIRVIRQICRRCVD
jgi:hypothetical protein